MKFFYLEPMILRNADAGGAASTAGAGGGQTAPAGGAPGVAPSPGAPSPGAGGDWAPPDFLPQTLRGEDMRDTFDRVSVDWKRQRDEFAKMPQPGKSAEDYAFQPSEKVKELVGDLSKDPIYGLAREAALRAGMPVATFQNMLGTLYENMAEKGLLAAPYSVEGEMKKFFGDAGNAMSPEQMQQQLAPVVVGLNDFIGGLANQLQMGAGEKTSLQMMLDSADGIRALQKIQGAMNQPGLSPGGAGAPAAGVTREQLRARQSDARNDRDSIAYNEAFAQETERLYRETFR